MHQSTANMILNGTAVVTVTSTAKILISLQFSNSYRRTAMIMLKCHRNSKLYRHDNAIVRVNSTATI